MVWRGEIEQSTGQECETAHAETDVCQRAVRARFVEEHIVATEVRWRTVSWVFAAHVGRPFVFCVVSDREDESRSDPGDARTADGDSERALQLTGFRPIVLRRRDAEHSCRWLLGRSH